MALMLTSRGLLRQAHHMIETNKVVRSGAVTGTAAALGLAMGRRKDIKQAPLIATGAGAALSFFGMTGIGDGAMAAGATLIGYRAGVKGLKKPALPVAPAPIVVKRRGLFRGRG